MLIKRKKRMFLAIITFIIFIMSNICSVNNIMIANAIEESNVDENMVVNIPDNNLKNLIKESLKITGDEVTVKDMSNIFSINATDIEVNSLEGLQYCTGLTFLYIAKGSVSDLKPIGQLPKLQYLQLYNCNVTSFEAISQLSSLENLMCDNLNLKNDGSIKNLKGLKYLKLDNCNLRDMDFVSNLSNLTSLSLKNNYIEEIKGIENLNEINSIELENNEISDISPLIYIPNHKSSKIFEKGIINLSENLIGSSSDTKSKEIKEKLSNKGFELRFYEYAAKNDMHLMRIDGNRYIPGNEYQLDANNEIKLEFTKNVILKDVEYGIEVYDDKYQTIFDYTLNYDKNILTIKFGKNIDQGRKFLVGIYEIGIEGVSNCSFEVIGYNEVSAPVTKIPGDVNNDGKVDIEDLSVVAKDYNKMKSSSTDWNEDEDCVSDGIIDIYDICFISSKLK